ncbi:hypothetical protein [uncultured Flavobacterium sp.]|uniref:hypothetical protein n=1 Tax=uncultured Flavobacterium sp. TaxID=165435 RepID=UPI0030EE74DB|tara:strand:+ start:4824 stop:5066 length:243 start_codon:yes stop_codon:yes gene_type:complete
MSTITIDKKVPLPLKRNRRIYPLDIMEVADSFEVKIENNNKAYSKKQNVYMAIWRFCKENTEKKFTTASTEKGIRIWRLK